MPSLYHNEIINLKDSYNNMRWFEKLFFPYQLAFELERYSEQDENNPAQLAVFKAFENSTWFFHKWFFTSLQRFSDLNITKSLRILNVAGLLTEDTAQANFNAVVAHQDPWPVAHALRTLRTAGLLTGDTAQANRDTVVAHQDPSAVADALIHLHTTGLLTEDTAQANFNAMVANQDPSAVADALIHLHTAGLLTGNAAQANRDTVVAHKDPSAVADVLIHLHTTGLLTEDTAQANFNAMVEHQNPWIVADVLSDLHTAGLFTGDTAQANFNALVEHQNPWPLGNALLTLRTAGLLTGDTAQANRDAVVANQKPSAVANALLTLHTAGLLTGDTAQANRDAVVAHQDPGPVAKALSTLHTAGLLTGDTAQANFNAVVITHTAILFHPNNLHNGVNLWRIMPHGRPTAAQFQEMIQIAQTHAANPDVGSQALMRYVVEHILGINPQQNGQQPVFNNNQSTHTASVHASASQTALKLLKRYKSRIQDQAALNTTIQAFASWVNVHTPTNCKQQAAVRCISRLRGPVASYTDRLSRVSTQQFMALAWIAIHDETTRTGELDDAKQQLIEALYEIQRGYNLSETGVDDNAPEDRPICTAGTFNKWCEKLKGLHPDAVLLYITHEGASAKLQIVAREEARRYLDALTLDSQDDYLALQEQNGMLNSLWAEISTKVGNRLFDEFGSIYPQGRDSTAFTTFYSQGLYALDATQLTRPAAQSAVTPNPHTLFQVNQNSATQQPEDVLSATNRC